MRNKNWDDIRIMRDHLLKNSDWTQLPDTGLDAEMKTKWQDYRKKLRNITENFRSPINVEWPPVPKK